MTQPIRDEDRYKIVATNRRAPLRFEILETLEAGLVLTGPEVKSLRLGNANLQDGFARIDKDEIFLMNVHIAPYAMGSLHVEQDPLRTRKMLLHQKEILKWMGKTVLKGMTIVPLQIYFNAKGKAKVKLGLAQGKKGPDRRDDLKKKTVNREIRRDFSSKVRMR